VPISAFLRIRTAPQKAIGISPYEMLYGLPYLGLPSFETKDQFLQNYVLSLSSAMSSLRQQGLLAQTPPLKFPVLSNLPRDYILICTWSGEKLEPS
jgi:hypothetical protein